MKINVIVVLLISLFFTASSYAQEITCKRESIDYTRWRSGDVARKANPERLIIEIINEEKALLNNSVKGEIIKYKVNGVTTIKFDYLASDAATIKRVFKRFNNGKAVVEWEVGGARGSDTVGPARYRCEKETSSNNTFTSMNDFELCDALFFIIPNTEYTKVRTTISKKMNLLASSKWGNNWRADKDDYCKSILKNDTPNNVTDTNSTEDRSTLIFAQQTCKELGYTPKTEKYADCVMKLIDME